MSTTRLLASATLAGTFAPLVLPNCATTLPPPPPPAAESWCSVVRPLLLARGPKEDREVRCLPIPGEQELGLFGPVTAPKRHDLSACIPEWKKLVQTTPPGSIARSFRHTETWNAGARVDVSELPGFSWLPSARFSVRSTTAVTVAAELRDAHWAYLPDVEASLLRPYRSGKPECALTLAALCDPSSVFVEDVVRATPRVTIRTADRIDSSADVNWSALGISLDQSSAEAGLVTMTWGEPVTIGVPADAPQNRVLSPSSAVCQPARFCADPTNERTRYDATQCRHCAVDDYSFAVSTFGTGGERSCSPMDPSKTVTVRATVDVLIRTNDPKDPQGVQCTNDRGKVSFGVRGTSTDKVTYSNVASLEAKHPGPGTTEGRRTDIQLSATVSGATGYEVYFAVEDCLRFGCMEARDGGRCTVHVKRLDICEDGSC